MTTRICPHCKRDLPLSAFHKTKGRADGVYPVCSECKNREARERYTRDPEFRTQKAEAKRQRHVNNPASHERDKAKSLELYYRKCKDPVYVEEKRKRDRENWANNPQRRERKLETSRMLEKRNREKVNENHRVYIKYRYWNDPNFKVKNRAYHARRRAIRRTNGGGFSLEEWYTLCKLSENKCLCCGKPIKLEVDHIKPVINGGDSTVYNIQPLCMTCNRSKGVKTIDYRNSKILTWLQAQLVADFT